MPETVERTETVETLETVETTEKANPSETSDKSSENKLETLSPHFHKRLSSRGHNLTPHLRSTRRPTIFTSAFAVSSQRQHTTETTRTRYLQVFAGVTGFFAEHTVSHNMLDLLGNHKARYCGCLARFAHCYAGGRRNFFQILIRNENPTHSHLTTRAEAASYLTTKTLPIDDQDGEDVKTLADARASPKQITNFLNKRIGEESEFESLHSKHTKMHKLLFERWGETLAMDFTHGTNHLGYHLGSIMPTAATGRGFPVLYFICLDQQAMTISTILTYFEEKIPGRQMSQRNDLIVVMKRIIYSATETDYDTWYDVLRRYREENKRRAIFSNFEKNWNSCPRQVVLFFLQQVFHGWQYDYKSY
ncbi:hypothetical protein PC129_g13150 [Phytophthora cactorum]|uniref:ZSWIM1/3 RNaseH-like domain-containing protein n=2 Tax=Phytophthora cactorum TaxID=29920 RepID=A0A8T1HVF9_9STRA|nr:hypothetical protein PC129_g13150 [Phytophthora cactorum]KAG4049372.1 hypothetical protein PC123_g15340 [Phytophthora cactorum]